MEKGSRLHGLGVEAAQGKATIRDLRGSRSNRECLKVSPGRSPKTTD